LPKGFALHNVPLTSPHTNFYWPPKLCPATAKLCPYSLPLLFSTPSTTWPKLMSG